MTLVKEVDEEGHVYYVIRIKKALGFLCNLIRSRIAGDQLTCTTLAISEGQTVFS